MRVAGHLYRPGSSAREEAVLVRRGEHFLVVADGGGAGEEVAVSALDAPLAGVPPALTLADGRRFVPCEALPAGFAAGVAPSRRLWRWIDWLERLSPLKAAVLLVLLALAAGALRLAVPLAADGVAALVPARLEQAIGRQAFARFEQLALSPTRIGPARRARIAFAASELARRNGIRPVPAILFRDSTWLGANAFAFPGGPVVMTDELLELLDDDEAVAVIAHELGHVEGRHGLRQSLRIGGLLLLVSVVIADDGSLLEEMAAAAASLVHLGYSRAFESEADAAAARYLAAAGRSPQALAGALRKLAAACGPGCEGESWLATHPAMAERIAALHAGGP